MQLDIKSNNVLIRVGSYKTISAKCIVSLEFNKDFCHVQNTPCYKIVNSKVYACFLFELDEVDSNNVW